MKNYEAAIFFKYLREEHFQKDIGFISEAYSSVGKNLVVVGFENSSPLRDDVIYIKGSAQKRFAFIKTLWQICFLSKRVRQLILFHVTRENVILSLLFKFINPKGFIYIKCDMNIDSFYRNGGSFWVSKKSNDRILRYLAVKCIDKMSVETEIGVSLVDDFFNNKINVFYLPNTSSFPRIDDKKLVQKKNRILYVGRLGCKHKNVELILDAIEPLSLDGYHFDFIGPIYKCIERKIEKFNNNRKCSVTFHGPIYDKQRLREFYFEAKYLVLSSVSEGFPLVFPEALSAGCVIITSDIYAAKDVVLDEKYIFCNSDELVEILSTIPESYSAELSRRSRDLYDKFDRGKLINKYSHEIFNDIEM